MVYITAQCHGSSSQYIEPRPLWRSGINYVSLRGEGLYGGQWSPLINPLFCSAQAAEVINFDLKTVCKLQSHLEAGREAKARGGTGN